jgi:hypothetical protein
VDGAATFAAAVGVNPSGGRGNPSKAARNGAILIKSRSIERSTLKSKLQGALIRPSLDADPLIEPDSERTSSSQKFFHCFFHMKDSPLRF